MHRRDEQIRLGRHGQLANAVGRNAGFMVERSRQKQSEQHLQQRLARHRPCFAGLGLLKRSVLLLCGVFLAACKPAALQSEHLPPPCQQYLNYLQRCEQLIVGDDATRQQLFSQYREQALSQWQQESDYNKLAQSCQQGQQTLQQIFNPQGCE